MHSLLHRQQRRMQLHSKRHPIDAGHKVPVKGPDAARAIGLLQPAENRFIRCHQCAATLEPQGCFYQQLRIFFVRCLLLLRPVQP